ncbi:MAG: alanine racemase [Bradymonadaceae bacterium]
MKRESDHHLTLGLVEELTQGELIAVDREAGNREAGDREFAISEVVVDSRGILPGGSLFVAIEGSRFDGHGFVEEAFARGAGAALVHKRGEHSEGPTILVHDTQAALQRLAAGWRQRFEIPVVGVTGSNGKTIVKEMLSAILGQRHTLYRSPGSYNSQIGVPLALLGLRPEHELAIIEAGISQVGEMEHLQKMIAPTCGVITNISLAHAAGLEDLETTAREKLRLFDGLAGPLVYPGKERTLASRPLPGRPVPFWVFDDDPPEGLAGYIARITPAPIASGRATFEVHFPGGEVHDFALHVPGRHNVHNATAAVALATELGCPVDVIRQGLAAFELSEMRLEMHTTQTGITLINDAYNSDPVSARAALGVLDHYAGRQRAVAILGDMLDLGTRTKEAHRGIGEFIPRAGVDVLVCMGEFARQIGQSAMEHGMAAEHVHFCDDFDELHDLLEGLLRPQDVVLFKASRSIGLDRAAKRLIESVAPTRLFIDLDAITDNFHAIRRRVGTETKIMAVVKSFGYGNDATRVSQTLISQGVDALAVAYPDEAIPLRNKGLLIPILVTNTLAAEADKIVKYDLIGLVYSLPVAEVLQRHAVHLDKVISVHVEIDTGMNRVGLKPSDVRAFVEAMKDFPNLRITGAMTHFAAADDATEDEFTELQLARFDAVLNELADLGVELETVHAANTAGAWRVPRASYDMVRIGLGLYGLHPGPDVETQAIETRPALRMTTRIIHVHEIDAGESVGYGRTWTAPEPTRLATIAVGYNDGFPRFMSNGGEVLIGEERCPVVGNVCMDVTMIDVSALDHVEVGDEVVLFGTQGSESISVDEWATRGSTINYELLCNISPRVRRIFVRA